MVHKLYLTYNDVHRLCQEAAPRILADFSPQLIIAIGSGGYVPARILRSCLHQPGSANIQIQTIGLSLYETLPTKQTLSTAPAAVVTDATPPQLQSHLHPAADPTVVEVPGTHVKRTQWLDFSSPSGAEALVGRRILIVDDIDDTRATLEYTVRELEKDIEAARQRLGRDEPKAEFCIFVLHNKEKPKKGTLPREMMESGKYVAARDVEDVWICYPWEVKDIDEQDCMARAQAGP